MAQSRLRVGIWRSIQIRKLFREAKRFVFFYRAEPGDSGTLLFTVNGLDPPKVLGVFLGITTMRTTRSEKRGRAVTIPAADQMTWLLPTKEVIEKAEIFSRQSGIKSKNFFSR